MLGSKKRNFHADLHINKNHDIFNKAPEQQEHFHNPYTEFDQVQEFQN